MTDKSKPLDRLAERADNDRELRLASAEALEILNYIAANGMGPAARKEAIKVSTRLSRALNAPALDQTGFPIPMVIHCPLCGVQHVDEGEWITRPHRSHECQNCEHVWRVADVPTVGVMAIQTKGQNDNGAVKQVDEKEPEFTTGDNGRLMRVLKKLVILLPQIWPPFAEKSLLDEFVEAFYAQPPLMAEDNHDFNFEVRDRVEKYTGAYKLEGIVVARFLTIDGEERYVVEHRPVAPGMLHIYGPSNLRLLS